MEPKNKEMWLDITTVQDQMEGCNVELNALTGEKRKIDLDQAALEDWASGFLF